MSGPSVRWRSSTTYPVPWLLPGGSVFDGPSLSADPPPSLSFLRYPSSVFEIRNGTIRAIKIIDQRAWTTKGLGPGDSISLVSHAYPESHCSQDYIANETPQPYPYCSVELSPSRWLTFFADNQATGTPIVGVWLTVRPIA